MLACSAGKNTSTESTPDPTAEAVAEYEKKKKRNNTSAEVNSLEEYLRRIPGLQVSSSGVSIRGNNSSFQSNQPLFVVDGVRIGNDLRQASQLIDAKQIDKVNVLKDISETSFYGTAGANGVIVIKMKKG